MKGPGRCHFISAALGLGFGYCLSRMGFSRFDEVHEMFVFSDLRLTLGFAVAVIVSALGIAWVARDQEFARQRVHPGTLPGGLLFGAGWALCGACPAIVWVQLGEGQLSAIPSLAGILLGTVVYPTIHARFFRWPTESCSG